MKVEFEVKELVDVEVEIDGKKKKMNKGKVSVDIKGDLVKDPESKWDVTPFYRFLRDLYGKYIIPGRTSSTSPRGPPEGAWALSERRNPGSRHTHPGPAGPGLLLPGAVGCTKRD